MPVLTSECSRTRVVGAAPSALQRTDRHAVCRAARGARRRPAASPGSRGGAGRGGGPRLSEPERAGGRGARRVATAGGFVEAWITSPGSDVRADHVSGSSRQSGARTAGGCRAGQRESRVQQAERCEDCRRMSGGTEGERAVRADGLRALFRHVEEDFGCMSPCGVRPQSLPQTHGSDAARLGHLHVS